VTSASDHLTAALRDLIEACDGGGACDLHCGLTSQPDKVTYCFTHHESFPCLGEDIRKELKRATAALACWGTP